MPLPSLRAPTLHDFYLDLSLEEWAISEDDDDHISDNKPTSIGGHSNME